MRTATLIDDPKLARIATALREAFGARLVSALLFGSRARGDHQPDSDYDVAVFLTDHDITNDGQLLDDLGRTITGQEHPRVQLMAFGREGLAKRTTLMFNIRNEGVPLPGLDWPEVVAPPIAPDEGPMKPETKNLLEKADTRLEKAKKILNADVEDSAARDAYIAALYAARALIFEERNVAPKTHDGSKALFHDIAIRTGRIPADLNSVLEDGYAIKFIVDYSIDSTAPKDPAAFVGRAARFISAVKKLIEQPT